MCCGQFATFRFTSACVIHVLHALQFDEPPFLALKRPFTGIFNFLPLHWGPNRPGNMLSYPKSCCGSIATLSGVQFLLLPVHSCVQTIHVPDSPAEFQSHRLWTLITFFWLGSFAPYFRKSLKYTSISFSESLLLFCAFSKKTKNFHFFINHA
jgi:hypothetical protein